MAEQKDFNRILKTIKDNTTDEILDSLSDEQLKELRDALDCTSNASSFRLKQRAHQRTHFHTECES